MDIVSIFDKAGTFLGLVTAICYLYQLFYLLIPLLRRELGLPEAPTRRYAVLIAARNEEAVLPHLLDSIAAQDYPPDQITTFVVADNCTDRTAQVAREHGAIVFQRFDPNHVGKGYALHFLLDRIGQTLGLDRFDAFLIFDADNLLEPDYVRQIDRVRAAGYPAFCGCRNSKNYGDNWLSAGYGLWYLHESVHLNHSRMVLGTTCAVSGTGFGFTRALLEKMGGWNFFLLTEDIEFSTWCAVRGIPIGYCPDAVVYDEQPTSLRVSIRQRTRWVQGGIQVAIKYTPALLRGILHGGRRGWSCFDFTTLTFWGYGLGALSFVCALAAQCLDGNWTALIPMICRTVTGGYCSLFAVGALTLAMEWHRIRASGRAKLGSLFSFPIFLYTYIPISLSALFRKPRWAPIPHTRAISCAQLPKK